MVFVILDFLKRNGIAFLANHTELEEFTLRVAAGKARHSEIAKWLQDHSRA
jgi:prophage maintenance system killer protein